MSPKEKEGIGMWPQINLKECLIDAPEHRVQIMAAEGATTNLESLFRNLTKTAKGHVEAAKRMLFIWFNFVVFDSS
jgi:hypothetical protein